MFHATSDNKTLTTRSQHSVIRGKCVIMRSEGRCSRLHLELVELQKVRIHDGGRADSAEETPLLRAPLRQQPV